MLLFRAEPIFSVMVFYPTVSGDKGRCPTGVALDGAGIEKALRFASLREGY